MPEDDGREQDGDPDGDPPRVRLSVVAIMIFGVAGWRSRLHGIPLRSAEPIPEPIPGTTYDIGQHEIPRGFSRTMRLTNTPDFTEHQEK
jgi:hypothetical protein